MNTTTQASLAGETEAIELEEMLKPGITRATMKGLVYGGPGIIELKDIPIPEVFGNASKENAMKVIIEP